MSGRMRQAGKMDQEKEPYIILEAYSKKGIESLVLLWLDKGYVLLGGVQIVSHRPDGTLSESGLQFFQTMVFNEV